MSRERLPLIGSSKKKSAGNHLWFNKLQIDPGELGVDYVIM